MREINLKATKILAMTKKVIETPNVAGLRLCILTANAPEARDDQETLPID